MTQFFGGAMKKIKPDQIKDNVFKLIGQEWMLITAGNIKSFNTMTGAWGGFGVMWGKDIAICVVRPTRHTYKFIEKSDTFTLSFFADKYKKALQYCGSHSGKDVDKIKQTGLTPVKSSIDSVYFAEARLVLECKKIYTSDIDPKRFIDAEIDKNYPEKDYHRVYFGQIINCLIK
jgi:flavin reductase (DIM6/NTAB) family NADH-FMN oxidoreductase RutF